MSRAAVRAQITSYLAGANLVGVGTVLSARPRLTQAPQFDPAPMGGSGSVLIVHLVSDRRTRIAVGGQTNGRKVVKHEVALELIFRSVKADGVAAQNDHDQIVDSIVAAIEADRTLGSGLQANGAPAGPIWQAGEGPAGITVELGEPVEVDSTVAIEAAVRFEAWELISQ